MKKLLLGIATFVTMVVLCFVSAGAETYGVFEYSVLDDGTVSITRYEYYNNNATTVNIPSEIDGKKVTSIGDNAFNYSSQMTGGSSPLTTVVIPDGVTTIGEYAFSNCNVLKSVTIPESVTSIGERAFSNCSSLEAVSLPVGLTEISGYLFEQCVSLKSITIPDGVGIIGYKAFYNCSSLTSLTVPDSVAQIDGYAFSYCSALKSVTLSDRVTTIYDGAFEYCTSLTTVTLPKKVKTINGAAFAGCVSLTSISVHPDNQNFTSLNGMVFDKDTTSLAIFPAGKTYSADILPDTVIKIGEYAFSNNNFLTSVVLPDRITSIENYAFSYCEKLTSITLPAGLKQIDNSAFRYCKSLKSITIPDKVTDIGSGSFSYCSSLTEINISDSVKTIGDSAFSYCTSLSSVIIPDGVKSIGSSVFTSCSSLSLVTIPDSVTKIGSYSFSGTPLLKNQTTDVKYAGSWAIACSNASSIVIKDGTKHIADNAFTSRSKLESVTIPDGMLTIGTSAFSYCSSLATISIPDTVYKIGADAFYSTALLKNQTDSVKYAGKWIIKCDTSASSVAIKNDTRGIADKALYGCKLITEITIPDSVISIGSNAFGMCAGLKSIVVPADVMYIGDNAFYYCTSLVTAELYSSKITEINERTFYSCSNLSLVTLPESITSIGNYAFYGCENLSSAKIPDSVKSIGEYAFMYCKKLTSINLTEGITIINKSAFYNCSDLTSLSIPDTVTIIDSDAFNNCNDLTSVVIPESVTTISGGAFCDCDNLASVTIPGSVTYIGKNAFAKCYSLETITIPASVTHIGASAFTGCIILKSIEVDASNPAYVSVNGVLFNKDKTTLLCYPAGKTATSYTIPGTVISIGDNAFENCGAIRNVNIPDSVKNIGVYAFDECQALTSISIPGGVTALSDYIFSRCYSLSSVSIPAGVTTIGENAFYSTPLKSVTIPDSVVYIDDYAFRYCDSITTLTIPSSVKTIGNFAFSNCTSLSSVTLKEGTRSIGEYSFAYCNQLTSVTLPDGILSVDECGFYGCTGLKSVTIPKSVNNINEYAFGYYYLSDNGTYNMYQPVDGFTISCYTDTAGHKYAAENNFDFKLLYKKIASSVLSAATGDKQITLTWTAVKDASYYQIIRFSKGTYTLIANINGTSAVVKELTNGYEYTYLIKAVAADGRTSFSNAINVTPVAELAKSTLSAVAGNKEATLSWTAVSGASYYQIIRYSNGNYSLVAEISGTSATVKSLTNGFEYTYLIKAVAADGRTSFSNAVNVTPVAELAKSTLTAVAGNKEATLSWTAVSGASYYQIIRYSNGNYSLVAEISGTSATVKSLTNDFEYTYLIKAVAADGRTSFSNAINVTPVAELAKPTLSAVAGNKEATLSWTAVSGASYYQIIRYSNGNYSLVAEISGTSATVKSLTNDFEYTYLIKAVAADGRTSFSNAINVTPVAELAKPTLSAVAGNKEATLSWTAVSGASYYQIIRYSNGNYSLVAEISGTSATVKSLTNDFEYTYLIKAIAADGRTSFSNAVTVTPHA